MKRQLTFLAAGLFLFSAGCNPLNKVSNADMGPVIIGVIVLLVLIVFAGAKFIGKR